MVTIFNQQRFNRTRLAFETGQRNVRAKCPTFSHKAQTLQSPPESLVQRSHRCRRLNTGP